MHSRFLFAVDQMVALRADPTWIGGVAAVLPAADGMPHYRVFHGHGVIRNYAEDQLVAAPGIRENSVEGRTFGAFRSRLIGYLHERRSKVGTLAPHGAPAVSADVQITAADVPAGQYLFAVDTWTVASARPAFEVLGFAVDLGTGEPVEAVERRLLQLLVDSRISDVPAGADAVERARHALNNLTEHRRRAALAAANATSEAVMAGRLGRLAAHHKQNARLLAERIGAETDPEAARSCRVRRDQAELVYQQRRRMLGATSAAGIVRRRIAEGVLTVLQPSGA